MKKLSYITFILIITFCLLKNSEAQVEYKTYRGSFEKIRTIDGKSDIDYMPSIINNPRSSSNPNIDLIADSEVRKTSVGSKFRTKSNVSKPTIVQGFEDTFDAYAIPNDDALAVSNAGKLITMRNSKISFYDENLQLTLARSLTAFTSSLGISGAKWDPRVVYDQNEDRFIVVMLSGFNFSTNHLIIGFSDTNDPHDDWHFYSIPGNYLNDSTWSDYPTIAINENELFISLTNFADMTGWDTWDFYGARIVQINKFQGYNGEENIDYAYHVIDPGYGVDLPSEIYYYNVIPVKGGKTLYGPNMYFLSTLDCPFPDENGEFEPKDSLFLVEFTGTLYDEDFEIKSTFIQTDKKYGMTKQTPQPNGLALLTNYNTIKDAFYEHDFIHFVMNSIDFDNNSAGIFHGIIDDVGGENMISTNIISSDTMGIAYPSLVYTGDSPEDQSVVIGFNYASESLYPGNLSIKYKNGDYSNFLVLKEGEGNMNMTSSQAERWGDFTTMQIKHNEPELIYFTGSYGRFNQTRTWVSVLTIDEDLSKTDDFISNNIGSSVYPNPATEFFKVEFTIDRPQVCSFTLYDNTGRKVDEIYKRRLRVGLNKFSFNVRDLPKGTYHLIINGSESYQSQHKVVVN